MLKAVCQNTLLFHSHRKITARFDGGSLTSDAGWLLFGSLDRQHRLCEGFSSCISESRDRRYVRHDLLKLIRQRVLQIVAGYEDCNDADTLRSDPMLKTVCDQLPESDPDLATQPTFSRLENSVTKKDLMRLSQWLLGRYVRSLKKRRPSKIILDLDSTDDHTHGQQEFSFYHGYYRNHILHPLLIFDADTGDLVCVVLRPGNKGAASHIVPILKRVVEAIRQGVGTDVEIEIRADSGFATAAQQFFCNFRVGCGTGSSSLGSRVQKAVAREPLAVNLSKATSRSIKMRGRSSLHYSQRAIQRPHLLLQEKRPCQKPSEPRSRAAPYREPSLI